jgi:hypothetical protein
MHPNRRERMRRERPAPFSRAAASVFIPLKEAILTSSLSVIRGVENLVVATDQFVKTLIDRYDLLASFLVPQ